MPSSPTKKDASWWSRAKAQLLPVFVVLGVMWVLELIDFAAVGDPLNQYGIVPRSLSGLAGIPLAPFLHIDVLHHLVPNTVPFFVLGSLVALGGKQHFAGVSMFVALTAGLGTWFFGESGLHIGASGVIFGYLGFLVARGLFEKRMRWVLVSIAVGVAYISLIQSLAELRAGVSWTSHFFGFAGGVGLAMLCYVRIRKRAVGVAETSEAAE